MAIWPALLPAADITSLAGEWRIALDRSAEQTTAATANPNLPPGDGLTQEWYKKTLPGTDRIKLPGILQGQGYGNDISTTTPWVLTLGGDWWKTQPQALRDHFSQPGKTEVPFLAQPAKHYLGVAWYQRDVVIPASAPGRHFTLYLERAHWQTTVFVDDQSFPPNDSLVAPHVTDLGALTPGQHRLTIRVDNRTQLPAVGHLVDAHAVTDSLGGTWNGIVGRMELQAASPVWIADVQAYPNLAKKSAMVRVKVGNATGQAGTGTLSAGGASTAVNWDATGGTFDLEVPLGENAQPWSEFHPALQHLTINLKGANADDVQTVTFGLREIVAANQDLLLNGRIINVRSTHSGGDFPLTGYPAMDVEAWKKIFQTCQDYGLNGIRFHSWCPPDAAFTAADEMGFYLQPECGMWNDFTSPAMQQRLYDETARILQAYGNHPSFILLSPSNEPRNYARFTPTWAADWYKTDPRRLYSAGTGWSDPAQVAPGGAQFAALVAAPGGRGGQLRNTSGWFGKDYRAALQNVTVPVLAHEVGQWCAYPDFDVIHEFTGYLRPSNYDIFKYLAEQNGVLDEDHAFALASGRFQVECYKEEIEANLRTPGLAGFQLLDLHDYLGQGTALIGVVDAFWHPKTYVTGEQFRRFAGPTVPLARLSNRVFTSDQPLEADVEIYHFGDQPLTGAKPYWKITDVSGQAVAQGPFDTRDLPLGKSTALGHVSADLSKLPAPGAYKLVAGLTGTKIENDWNFWVYPAQPKTDVPTDVTVTDSWADAQGRLAAGGKVLFMPGPDALDRTLSPAMANVPVFWNIQMTVRPPANPTAKFDAMLGLLCDPKHPALAEFPTEINCDWQWTPLVNGVRSVNLTNAPRALKPIVWAIDDWNRNWKLGVIFEAKVGPGRLLVSAINLNASRGGAGLAQLRRSLLDYMGGAKFQPAATLTPAEAGGLWVSAPASAPPTGPRTFDPDLNDGTQPAAATAPKT